MNDLIIVLEGLDGAGKTSQAQGLVKWLRNSQRIAASLAKEPSDTATGQYLREYLKHSAGQNPVAEAGLFIAAQAENLEQRILPALQWREVVILDRFGPSTIAYQCARYGVPINAVIALQQHAIPDQLQLRYILLDISPHSSMQRTQSRTGAENNAYDLSRLEMRRISRESYLRQARSDPANWTVIDAELPFDAVTDQLRATVVRLLNNAGHTPAPDVVPAPRSDDSACQPGKDTRRRSIYLAARYRRRQELTEYGDQLKADGHIVTSRWVYVEGRSSDSKANTDELRTRYAQEDIEDLQAADTVIAFTEEEHSPYSRGGRHVELGMALAWHKDVYLVGNPENVFCHLPAVQRYDRWSDALRLHLRGDAQPAEL